MLKLIKQTLAPKSWLWWLSTFAATSIIFYFSLIHPPNFQRLGHWFWGNTDKIAHALAYFGLSLSLMFALNKASLQLVLLCFLYSFLLELAQAFQPVRQFDPGDLIANITGGLIALYLAKKLL